MRFIIKDWANNVCFKGETFSSFDDAEEFLSIELDENYETDRGEYYIEFDSYDILDTVSDYYFDQAEACYTACILWREQFDTLDEVACRLDFRPGMGWSETQVIEENEFYNQFDNWAKNKQYDKFELFAEELEHYFEHNKD